jgi:hypothetical protein
VAYEPPGYDPHTNKIPDKAELRKDLVRLHDAKEGGGFDGLITFGAGGDLAEIPRLAKEVGFQAVIMGIYILRDEAGKPVKPVDQMERAYEVREWVDGYCLGHNTSTQLDTHALADWMAELRSRTGKPVTTTAPLVNYLDERGRHLREIGDWYFPDLVGSWPFGTLSPVEVLRETKANLQLVAALPRNKPVLLKMISYPSGGAPGYTEEAQAAFFTGICRNLYLPSGVYVSVFSAYDLPWKRGDKDFSPQEEFVGLFTAQGEPKKAAAVLRLGFPIRSRW